MINIDQCATLKSSHDFLPQRHRPAARTPCDHRSLSSWTSREKTQALLSVSLTVKIACSIGIKIRVRVRCEFLSYPFTDRCGSPTRVEVFGKEISYQLRQILIIEIRPRHLIGAHVRYSDIHYFVRFSLSSRENSRFSIITSFVILRALSKRITVSRKDCY